MPNIENLKPFNKHNAKEMGRRGGIVSGITRRRKSTLKKRLQAMLDLSIYFDTLTKDEFNNFISDYTPIQQAYIKNLFNK